MQRVAARFAASAGRVAACALAAGFKASRKKRGHVSMGHGRVGKHRKHPGGRGKAGGEHHHRINFLKYHPGYFGKRGMRNFHVHALAEARPAINLEKLWSLLGQDVFEKAKATTDGTAPVLDLTKHGYFKVLGRAPPATFPKVPMIVKARYFSRKAVRLIKEAGGAAVVVRS